MNKDAEALFKKKRVVLAPFIEKGQNQFQVYCEVGFHILVQNGHNKYCKRKTSAAKVENHKYKIEIYNKKYLNISVQLRRTLDDRKACEQIPVKSLKGGDERVMMN